jgi:uncharacterized surface protein with fasciclin (FAS1) repeats
MKFLLFAGLALSCMLSVASSLSAVDPKDIFGNIGLSSNHTILLTAVKESKLEVTLSAKGAYTLFAPSDEAFKKLGDEQLKRLIEDKTLLRKILLAHFVVGKSLSSDDLKGMAGKELNGFTISVNDGLKIGDAKMKPVDLKCSNGVIHTIDTVLIPK